MASQYPQNLGLFSASNITYISFEALGLYFCYIIITVDNNQRQQSVDQDISALLCDIFFLRGKSSSPMLSAM
jgi:hypothetical protein